MRGILPLSSAQPLPHLWRAATLLGLLGAGLLSGCAGSADGPTAPRASPPARVVTAPVESGALEIEHVFLGQAEAKNTVLLAAPVAGIVDRVTPRVGDRMESGETAVALDESLIRPRIAAARAEVDRVDADLAQAKREQARVAKLSYPVASEAEQEKFRARVQSLTAQVASAKANLRLLSAEAERHTVQAPFNGVVRTRLIEPGAWVNPGTPLLELVSSEHLEIVVDVTPAILSRLNRDEKASIRKDGQEISATLVGLVPALEEKTRTARVRLLPDERPRWLLAGRSVEVVFKLTQAAEGPVVPRDALVRGPGGVRIIEALDGKARSIPVTIVAMNGEKAMIKGDLETGAQVVIRGNERLRPDQPLQIAPPTPRAAPQRASGGTH